MLNRLLSLSEPSRREAETDARNELSRGRGRLEICAHIGKDVPLTEELCQVLLMHSRPHTVRK